MRPGTSQKSSMMKVSSNTPPSRIGGCAEAAVASDIEATAVRAAAAASRESLMVSPSWRDDRLHTASNPPTVRGTLRRAR